jgi:hypothetical protein
MHLVEYGEMTFVIEVEVDAVQTHSAEAAILGAWGIDVTVSDDGTLSLN